MVIANARTPVSWVIAADGVLVEDRPARVGAVRAARRHIRLVCDHHAAFHRDRLYFCRTPHGIFALAPLCVASPGCTLMQARVEDPPLPSADALVNQRASERVVATHGINVEDGQSGGVAV